MLNGSSNALQFDIDFFGTFDGTKEYLVAQNSGLYWMHVAADIALRTPALLSLDDSALILSKKSRNLSGADTICKDGIVFVRKASQSFLVSKHSTVGIYWLGFRLDTLFEPLIAFHVVRTTSINVKKKLVSFDKVLWNVGNPWNNFSNQFVVPYDGFYFFSFRGGVESGSKFSIFLKRDESEMCQATASVGKIMDRSEVDFTSKSCFISLKKRDKITLHGTDKGPFIYSNGKDQEISLLGFFYSPINRQKVSLVPRESRPTV